MKELLTYALGVVVCSGLFVTFYRAVLHGRTSFRTSRIFLPASLVSAAVIPALDIPVWRTAPVEAAIVTLPASPPAAMSVVPVAPASHVDWPGIVLWVLWIIWGLGIAVLTGMMVWQFGRIVRIKKRAGVHRTPLCEIALSEEIDAPFSFFGTVFIEKGTPDREVRQIVTHEASHIRHRHSQEKIAMEIVKNLLWFNPFAWRARRLLAEIHEFEADRDVLDGGFTVEEYLPLIFRQIFGYNPELSVGLGDSLTKKRFLMMKNKMKLTRFSWLRVAGVLPIAAGMITLFSFTSRPPEIIRPEAVATGEQVAMAAEEPVATVEKFMEESVSGELKSESLSDRVETVREEPVPAAQKPEKPEKPEDIPVFQTKVMPTFQGGSLLDFRNWVGGKLIYPAEAMEKGIQGKVALKYVIERDGSVSNVEIISSPSKSLSDEAARVVKSSPKWTPGTKGGKPVRVAYILPVDFTLASSPAKSATADKGAGNTAAVDDYVVSSIRSRIAQVLIYPRGAVEAKISGRVTAKFTVEKDGSATNVMILSSPNQILSDEIVRVIGTLPKMVATIDGKPVSMNLVMPVNFVLTDGDGQTIEPIAAPEPTERPNVKEIVVVALASTEKAPGIESKTQTGSGSAKPDSPSPESAPTTGAHLYFLDGKEIDEEQLKNMDLTKIDSFSVLREASATALYGERGRHGAVLITTKKEGEASGNATIELKAEKETPMGIIKDLKAKLREMSALKIDMVAQQAK